MAVFSLTMTDAERDALDNINLIRAVAAHLETILLADMDDRTRLAMLTHDLEGIAATCRVTQRLLGMKPEDQG